MIASAFEILKTAAAKLDTSHTENDEVTSFLKFVTTKVKNYFPETGKGVQHAVFDIIKNTDRGYYEWLPKMFITATTSHIPQTVNIGTSCPINQLPNFVSHNLHNLI